MEAVTFVLANHTMKKGRCTLGTCRKLKNEFYTATTAPDLSTGHYFTLRLWTISGSPGTVQHTVRGNSTQSGGGPEQLGGTNAIIRSGHNFAEQHNSAVITATSHVPPHSSSRNAPQSHGGHSSWPSNLPHCALEEPSQP